jgi:hypothetical protein
LGVAELYDFEWFFGPFTVPLPPEVLKQLRLKPDDRAVYIPRRAYDLWNTRYFVLPGGVVANHNDRGVYSLLQDTLPVYPKPGTFKGPDGETRAGEWLRNEDLQVLRNPHAMPRAWIVHDARFSPPIEGLSRADRKNPMEEMLYKGDPLWTDPDRIVYDPRSIAWIETANPQSLARYRTGRRTSSNETVTVREVSPVRVELDASLEQPGLVILADALYPGWTLTVNNKPAPILRANRMMRGAALEAGKNRLVYEYRPRSFAIGKVASVLGLIGFAASLIWARRGQRVSVEKKLRIGQSNVKTGVM